MEKDISEDSQPVPFRLNAAGLHGESGLEGIVRWRSTFHRLRDALAEPPVNADLDMMIHRLGQIRSGPSGE